MNAYNSTLSDGTYKSGNFLIDTGDKITIRRKVSEI